MKQNDNTLKITRGCVDGDYFWISPCEMIEKDDELYSNKVKVSDNAISILDNDFRKYLIYFFIKYFNNNHKYNQNRVDVVDKGENRKVNGFVWMFEYNFYSYSQMEELLKDIECLCALLKADDRDRIKLNYPDCEYNWQLNANFNQITHSDNNIAEYKSCAKIDLLDNIISQSESVIDVCEFYEQFIDEMHWMIKNNQSLKNIFVVAP